MYRLLYGFFYLSLLFAHILADCQLSSSQISLTNRIFAFHSESQYFPQRLDIVPTDQILQMICNPQDVIQTKCQANGSFKPALPMDDCSNPLKAVVEPITDASCSYTMYRVGYKLSATEFLEIYRSCYQAETVTAHFTIHLAYPYTVSANRPMQSFTSDGIITGATAASFEAKNIYARFEALLGPNQPYIKSSRDLVFDRGHLVPSADFVFDQSQRQTFKYINVVAQFRTINRSNWKTIENWVRRQLAERHFEVLRICTGVLGVLQLPDQSEQMKSVFLAGADRNPIPEWLYKIVSDGADSRIVFLTSNNANQVLQPTTYCEKVSCPASVQLQQTKEAGLTYCCEATKFLNKNLPHLKDVC